MNTRPHKTWSLTLSALALALTTCTAVPTSASVFKADFDGDGVEDLVMGVPEKDVSTERSAGAVMVFYGRSIGLTSSPHQQFDQHTAGILDQIEKEDHFGTATAIGDYNGDGYDDLAVGVPQEDFDGKTNNGVVNVIYGSPTGLQAADNQLLSLELIAINNLREANTAFFGTALAAGDFNRDGYGDLAVGAPGAGWKTISSVTTTPIGAVQVQRSQMDQTVPSLGMLSRTMSRATTTVAGW
jgi:hypothetical protein